LFGFIMAEILQTAFQNEIDEQGEMEDKKSQKAPAIDSVNGTGPDIIQPPKTGVKEVTTDEGADAVQASSPVFNLKPPQSNMNDAGTNAAITAKEANKRVPDAKAESVKAAPPELNPKMTKPGENDAAQEALAAEAKAPASDQGTSPVIATAAELNPTNPTKATANDTGIDVTSTVEDPEVMVATVSDSIPMVMATNDDGRTPPELNQKLTQPGENNAATNASAAEANATNDDGGTVSQREVSQLPSVNQMVLDLKRKIVEDVEKKSSDATSEGSVEENKSSDGTDEGSVEESKSSDARAEGSVEENKSSDATSEGSVEENKSSDGTYEGSVEESKSSDATAEGSVEESKSSDATAVGSVEESKSSDGKAEGLVEPAMVSLSALSEMSPSPGPKADEYQPATQYSPSPGPFTEKNRPRTRSTTSPDPKKKQSSVSAVANGSSMHSGRNFDALVGMDSVSKAAFHRSLRRRQKYTQAYLDHAYDIVHDFHKCDIRVLHVIEPKEGGAVQDDKDTKDCKPDPTEKPVEIGSPPPIKTDTPSNQMVTGFPPTRQTNLYM
jgi:hypothetical protein